MCIAIEEMRKDAIAIGIAQERAQSAIAIQEAREQGIAQERAQSAIAIQKAKEQGIEKGIEQGIVLGAIKICHDLGMESNDILARITGKFSLTHDEAESYMRLALANA